MSPFKPMIGVDLHADRLARAFEPEEHRVIARWADTATRLGLQVAIYAGLYERIEEVLVVTEVGSREPSWLIHKTPEGKVAVRCWPGLAEIVATVRDALDIVTAAVERAGD